MHYAAACGSTEVCRAILKKGGNPNVVDKAKISPAHDAAFGGHFEVSLILNENETKKNGIQMFIHDIFSLVKSRKSIFSARF